MTNTNANRKPCIALMGEFSAGKSTLANLLIGADPLPVQVVATQLPPVRISHGCADPAAVFTDGTRKKIDLSSFAETDLSEILHIQIFCEEDVLLKCDLLDMPGISDPNMDADIWERMIDQADGVLWCSHATQAWRQSEAAVWAEMDPALRPNSLLLLTRADKLTPDERARVLARVTRETQGLFADVLPISLLSAIEEQDRYDLWAQSGAEEFAQKLIGLLSRLNGTSETSHSQAAMLPGLTAPQGTERATDTDQNYPRVTPRRIVARSTPHDAGHATGLAPE